MLNSLPTHRYDKVVAAESKSVAKIPWKPIPASQLAVITAEHDDSSTALSVLYSSEYVNGKIMIILTAVILYLLFRPWILSI